jgi:hypothetical protein
MYSENQTLGRSSVAVLLVALTVAGSAFAWAFLVIHPVTIDDLGLFNPVYMYVNYGIMTYPAYGQFHSMYVHPPTHYVVLALLMKAGVPLEYATQIPPFLLVLIGILLIIRSTFPDTVRVSLLFGLFGGSIVPLLGFGFGVRPDLHFAFAFFVGLVALESGRLLNWDPKRLFLGSFLLSYASGLQYPGIVAFTGILVYLVWVLKERAWGRLSFLRRKGIFLSFFLPRRVIKPVASLVLGACLFGIPYLILFIVPEFIHIISFVKSAGAIGGTAASLSSHLRLYESIYADLPSGMLKSVFYPLAIGIPTVLLSTAILFSVRATRGLALASLPAMLFLLLLVQRKWSVYLIPEFMLYLCSLSILAILALNSLVVKILPRYRRLVVPVSSVILIIVLLVGRGIYPLEYAVWTPDVHAVEFSLEPRLDELAIARAAGRQILGPDALVGARIARSYIYGEAFSYMIEPDLLSHSIAGLNLTAYFAEFDAIAEDSFRSDATYNEQHESLSSWYADGMLNIRGFYFSSRQSSLSYLLLSVHHPEVVPGYSILRNGQVVHFQERPDGDYVFVAVVCDASSLNAPATALFHKSYLLPLQSGNRSQQEVLTFVLKTESYLPVRSEIMSKCVIRDEIRLGGETLEPDQLMASLADDRRVEFYETLKDALAARSLRRENRTETSHCDTFALRDISHRVETCFSGLRTSDKVEAFNCIRARTCHFTAEDAYLTLHLYLKSNSTVMDEMREWERSETLTTGCLGYTFSAPDDSRLESPKTDLNSSVGDMMGRWTLSLEECGGDLS